MHAFMLAVGKTLNHIDRALNDFQDDGLCDYYLIGGRYNYVLPVNKKTKSVCREDRFEENHPYMLGNGFVWNPNIRYTNGCRIRQINLEEAARLRDGGGMDIFRPCNTLMCFSDNYRFLEEGDFDMRDILNNDTLYKSWFVLVIDYHY